MNAEKNKKVVVIVINYMKMSIFFYKDDVLKRHITNELTIDKSVRVKSMYGGYEYDTERVPCYSARKFGSNAFVVKTGFGFLPRIRMLLRKLGIQYIVDVQTPTLAADKKALTPNNRYVDVNALRAEQKSIVDEVINNDFGQFVAATGAGKTFLIRTLCQLYPSATFLITTYSLNLLKEVYEAFLANGVTNVAMFSSKSKQKEARIQLCSVDSLRHFSAKKYHFLLIDERHEVCTAKRMQYIMQVKAHKCFGFSANEKDRTDKADKWTEACCGPVRFNADYQSSVKHGSVVPIKVKWVPANFTGLSGLDSKSQWFNKNAYWRNEKRNILIAEEAKNAAKNGPVMIFVKTVEHIYALKQHLDCPVVHARQPDQSWARLRGKRLIAPDFTQPTAEDMSKTKADFAAGKIPIVIANTVWKRGVDFPKLRTLIMAHGGSSAEEIIQAGGRVSRKHPGKKFGLVIDFTDEFNFSANSRAKKRNAVYNRQKWEMLTNDKP
jgi:superfamily II DNA or RNA helicase